jgi:hypothetical protein
MTKFELIKMIIDRNERLVLHNKMMIEENNRVIAENNKLIEYLQKEKASREN